MYSTNELPEELRVHLESGGLVEAHNVAFELSIWQNVMVKRYDWPEIPIDRWLDSMAVAAYYAMPMALDRLAHACGYEGKDAAGGRLISKYSCLYNKNAKTEIPPEDHRKFVDYCRRDVQIEQSISDFLGPLPERELPIFQRDLRIAMRGLYLDQEGIDAATSIVDQRSEDLAKEFRKITGLNPTQRDKVMAWFASQGLELPNMKKDTLEEIVEGLEEAEETDLSLRSNFFLAKHVRRAIEIRLKINKASTKKLDAMTRQRGSDGRARFQFRYHGAGTGRNTGSGFQPLNLNRGFEDVPPDRLVGDVMHRDPSWLDMIYGDAMDAVAKASRHWIQAEPGNIIRSGDFVSIEAVVLACLAGEDWKVEAFRSGAKIYEMMADKIYGLPPGTVTKKTHPTERQDGKTGELAFGYQGALNAWLKFDSSGRHTDERIIEICKAWRAEHPAIVAFWRGLERAAIEAVRAGQGVETGYRDIGFEIDQEYLSMILPNGKRIWYFQPQLRPGMPQWHKPAWDENGIPNECAEGTCDCRPVPKLCYMAQKEGRWKRVYTYGGKLAENATQATSREILKPAEARLEAAGYSMILSVYDECVTEDRIGFGSVKEFGELLKQPEDWFADWPIGVDVWEGDRYKK